MLIVTHQVWSTKYKPTAEVQNTDDEDDGGESKESFIVFSLIWSEIDINLGVPRHKTVISWGSKKGPLRMVEHQCQQCGQEAETGINI